MRIAVCGLGKMGSAIASRLLDRGHAVTVWNRTPGKAVELIARGAHEVAIPAEACRDTEAVITMLADDAAVLSVVLGDDGVAAGLGDAVLVDVSTVAPATAAALRDRVGSAQFVSAPILAGPPAVLAGQGLLLLGGDDVVLDRLSSLWADLTTSQVRCGTAEAALTAKLFANMTMISTMAAIAEAIVMAQSTGMSNAALRALLDQLPTVSPAMRPRVEDMIDGDHSPSRFDVALAEKDMRLARELLDKSGARSRVVAAVEGMLRDTTAMGRAAEDMAAVVEVVRAKR